MKALTGTGALVRLALRRDRIKLPVWILAIVGLLAAGAPALRELYDTYDKLALYASTTAPSVVGRMLGGPIDGPRIGSVLTVEYFLFTAVLIAFMSALGVIRHTRQNEETGRSELIGSAVVGRHAALMAALVVIIGVNILIAILIMFVLLLSGYEAAGSVGMAAAIGGVGVVFAAAAAVTAQLSGSARGASGLAGAAIGVAFLLRAIGDGLGTVSADKMAVTSAWPSYLSPIGWGQQMHPYTRGKWQLLALYVVAFAALSGLAFYLTTRRDVGLGMLPAKRGPAKAAQGLLSPFGLAWRLQRGVLAYWTIGIAIMGVTLGVVAVEFRDMLTENAEFAEIMRQIGGTDGSITDIFFSGMLSMLGIGIAGYVLQALLRMHTEEDNGRLEPLLATAVSRPKWLLSHGLCALAGVIILSIVAGLSAGLAYWLTADVAFAEVPRIAMAALVQIPAILTLGALAVALFGLLPRWVSVLSWSAFVLCLVLNYFGALLKLPDWILKLTPFAHTPPAPAASVSMAPLVVMLLVALGLTTIGLLAFQRRSLAAS